MLALTSIAVNAQENSSAVQDHIRAGRYSQEIQKFYAANNFSLAWSDAHDIRELTSAIQTISIDGLDPNDYNLSSLMSRSLTSLSRDSDRIEFDLLLTQSFLKLARHLYQGKIDPDRLFPGDWEVCPMTADYPGLLSSALGGVGICETLQLLRPVDNGYEALKYLLTDFETIRSDGDLPGIAFGNPIKPGDSDDRMATVRSHLSLLKLIPRDLNNGEIRYDSNLIFAVERFQRLHGLTPDGTIGRRTQQAMQLTAQDYIETITVNLEKYRWHQSRLLPRSIQINIPSYQLSLTEDERTELEMRAIIGKTDRPTPILSSAITAIIINPTWTVPPTVLKEDVLPAIKTDKGYLRRHNMRLVNRANQEINPDSINWSGISIQNFPYQIQQEAGPTNPLGRIKFFFPNRHTVYLHDTNVPSLFRSQDRALSSGCIRIESPLSIVRLLTPLSGWTDEMVREEIEIGETKTILLRGSFPIHLTYFTAFVRNDELYVFKDLYGYDKAILEALRENQPVLLD
jgi:murein L,D-transpeptidase YcbB/YkuD